MMPISRHLADAHLLFEDHGHTFDFGRIRKWCEELGVAERLSGFDPGAS